MKFTAIDLGTEECKRIFFEMSLGELVYGGRNMIISGFDKWKKKIVTNISDLSDIQIVDCDSNRSQLYWE